jgi:amino acid permease
MSHIDELTLMMYVDQELLPEEHAQVSAHLNACPSCSKAYSLWKEDHQLFQQTFTDVSGLSSSFTFQAHVEEQIEMIANLHSHHRKISYRRRFFWAGGLIAAVLVYLLWLQSWFDETAASVWAFWQTHVFWISTFWLKENADQLLSLPVEYFFAFSLVFTAMFIGLIVLNYRRPALQPWEEPTGGMDE